MITKTIDSGNLAGGAIQERIDDALAQLIENILDVNTSPKVVREVNLKIRLKPADDRKSCEYQIQCTTKQAPVKEIISTVFVGVEGGKAVMAEVDTAQLDLFKRKEGSND